MLDLGRSGDPAALRELTGMLSLPSNEVQRLAPSAIGKLADFGADAETAVAALAPLALKGRHPQTQQYAIRALKKSGTAARGHAVRRPRRFAFPEREGHYLRVSRGTAPGPEMTDDAIRQRGIQGHNAKGIGHVTDPV